MRSSPPQHGGSRVRRSARTEGGRWGGNWIGVVVAKTRTVGFIEGYGYAVHGEDALTWATEQLRARGVSLTTGEPPAQPMRPSAIARRLPASVVRVVSRS
jgi:hypothetical protein